MRELYLNFKKKTNRQHILYDENACIKRCKWDTFLTLVPKNDHVTQMTLLICEMAIGPLLWQFIDTVASDSLVFFPFL